MSNGSPFIISTITLCFLFSTMYGLAFLYNQEAKLPFESTSEIDRFTGETYNTKNPGITSTIYDYLLLTIDFVLEFISILSPIGLFKGFLVITGTQTNTPEIDILLNLFILRPLGWAMFLIEANYIISKIPTVSGET